MGLLINFGHYPKLEYERIVNTKKMKPADQTEGNGPQITQMDADKTGNEPL